MEVWSLEQRGLNRDRHAYLLSVDLSDIEGNLHAARIRNLSHTGMGGVTTGLIDLLPGQRIKVHFRGSRPVSAVVAWSVDGDFGAAFERRVNPTAILAAARANRKPFEPMDIHRVSNRAWRPGIKQQDVG